MDLATLANTIWSELSRAQADREHPWRTPVLASVDSEGLPQARSVVLRKVCSDTQTLQIYTDSRSPKVKQLQTSAQIQLVFWSSSLNWQLRVSAQAKISRRGPDVDAAWQQVKQSPARQDYLSPSRQATRWTRNCIGSRATLIIWPLLARPSLKWIGCL